MAVSDIAHIRAFNRFYTRVLGLLQPDLAGSGFSLTEARVLYEVAQSASTTVAELRRSLDLDAGYLSRILSGFTRTGILTRESSAGDARRQVVALTEDGRRAFAELDRLQADAIEKMLAPLDAAQRARLTAAMHSIRDVLGDRPRSRGLVLRAPEPGDLGWVVERHGYRYAHEYGWDATFESLVAQVVGGFEHDGRRAAAWIAELDGERVGCVFCTPAGDEGVAQLRLLLVEPSARGAGVGTRLVQECLRFAKRAGYTRIMLWTNDVLVEARRIYERAGFQIDRREAHHSFGHDLVGEYWSRDL
ncbi:Transcriptional regulator [uncultured Mycobacterium sp.]|uniref:Transcriptional regulator n=1 Tax=uncultured Mycobacterium sp. TaxID=171292 RepID=A0A1Y5P5J4_9MYCO|nr:Transcriptional regulator [uncultured Mycobacterium sp.]